MDMCRFDEQRDMFNAGMQLQNQLQQQQLSIQAQWRQAQQVQIGAVQSIVSHVRRVRRRRCTDRNAATAADSSPSE